MTEVKIDAFGSKEIKKVITSALPPSNTEDAAGLAAICLKRTLGNPFFVLEFLKMLYHEGLLEYDAALQAWKWDTEQIDEATMSTANVVVMLHDHLTKMPHQVQALLQCAAYLGSTFKGSTIDIVWTTYGRRLVETKAEEVKWHQAS